MGQSIAFRGRESFTVTEWLEDVLVERKAAKYRDTKTERVMIRTHVAKDPLGRKTIVEVEGAEARAWWRRMLDKGLSWSSLRNVLSFVRVGVQVAVSEGLRDGNPFRDLAVPRSLKVTTREAFEGALSDEEQRALVQAALALHKESRATWCEVAMLRTALGAGLRRGELLSLRWEDVALEGEEPAILVRYGAEARGTKGGKPRRVPLFGDALVALRTWRGVAESEGERVFPGARGRRKKDVPRGVLRAALAKAGIARRVRWHDLRHSCATALLEGERGRAWSTQEVQQLLGHSSVTMTERYVHAKGALLQRAAREQRAVTTHDTIPAPPPDMAPLRSLLSRLRSKLLDDGPPHPLDPIRSERTRLNGLEAAKETRTRSGEGTDSSPVHPADVPSPESTPEGGDAMQGLAGRIAERADALAKQVADEASVELRAEFGHAVDVLVSELDAEEHAEESRAWDLYVAALLQCDKPPGITDPKAIADAVGRSADLMLEERRKRFGGSR